MRVPYSGCAILRDGWQGWGGLLSGKHLVVSLTGLIIAPVLKDLLPFFCAREAGRMFV